MITNSNVDFIKNNYCPNLRHQMFMWFAEYEDGTEIYEMDNDCKETPFDSIDKDKLKRFGLLGNGGRIYFDIKDGVIILDNRKINFNLLEVLEDNKEKEEIKSNAIKITGRTDTKYNDIIQYKKGVLDVPLGGETKNQQMTTAINFIGFKVKIRTNDNIWNIQYILCVPVGNPYILRVRVNSMQKDSNALMELVSVDENNRDTKSISPSIEFKKDTPQEFMIQI